MPTNASAHRRALRTPTAALVALLLGSLLVAVAPSHATPRSERDGAAPVVARGAALTISPRLYVGGQRLTFQWLGGPMTCRLSGTIWDGGSVSEEDLLRIATSTQLARS